jgi:DivIVA domain-containing protein
MDTLSTKLEDTTFPLSRRGYDTAAVDRFMDNLKEVVVELEARLMVAMSKSGSLEHQMRAVGDAEHVAEAAFVAAADAKRRLIAQAERKASEIIAEANASAARLVGEPERAVEKARRDADEMLSEAVKRIEASDAQAARIIERAELTARTTLADARNSATEISSNAQESTTHDIAHATREYERIQVLLSSLKRAVADSMAELDTAHPAEVAPGLAVDLSAAELSNGAVTEIR